MSDYTVDKVSWHLEVKDNPESPEKIKARFFHFYTFLQNHKLVDEILVSSINDVDDDFMIHTSRLTEKGVILVKACYDKWLGKVDKGMPPSNLDIFEAYLINN